MDQIQSITQRFTVFFARELALQAASPLAEGVEMGFRVQASNGEVLEEFCFKRQAGTNSIIAGPGATPQVIFTLTPQAAEEILNDPSEDIGAIGVNIAKLIASTDADKRISVKLKSGFMELFTKGYFGVIAKGGQQFASHLAAMGLNGITAIRNTIKGMKG